MMVNVIDFFSGCGGTSCGLAQAGLDIIAGLDSDHDAASTYKTNINHKSFFEIDIRELPASAIEGVISRDRPLLFSGCAPCQPFSKQNRNLRALDPRRDLLVEFSRFVEVWHPDYILIENVPGLQKIDDSEGPLPAFCALLKKMGYFFVLGVLPALWFGVPQTRERLILLASRQDGLGLPRATHGTEFLPPSTVREWIAELPSISAGEVHPHDSDHCASGLSPINLARIASTPEGGGREFWPDELWLDCHRNYKGHSDVYGRLAWDKPASGLTTRCISYSNGRFGHPTQNRAISIREAARLQTFPRDYRFCGSRESRARQIGNAVPPLMAQRIGDAIMYHASQCAA